MLVAVAFFAAAVPAASVKVTPLGKVIEMLDDMTAKGKEDKHAEEVDFASFQQWCTSLREEKTKSIAEAEAQITQLEADIAKNEADAAALADEIKELEGLIAKAKKELAEAKAVREREKADYDAQHADFSESIDALERAIQVLKSREADVPQSLAQVRSAQWMPMKAKVVLESFLEMSEEPEEPSGPPQANAYEFQSGGVVAIMEKLRHKFQDQLLALEKEEMNAKANFEMLAQKLEDNIKADTETVEEKTSRRAERLEAAATAKGDLAITKKTKADDEKTLSDTLVECDAKSKEYEKNQVLRKEELEAIKKARDILQSPEVAGNAEKYLPKLAQVDATSLAQVRAEGNKETARRQKAIAYLQGQAKKLGSKSLAMMSLRVAEDPFLKVKKMIKDLIVQLMEQANQEADHNAFCTSELATNKQTRENKAAKAEELTAVAEKLTADITLLSEEITQLADDIATTLKEQKEATDQRAEDKSVNEQTISDAKDGQAAIERALKVLRDFYDKAAEAAFVQEQAAEPYQGMQSSKGGVIGLLEVCLSDFARLETETSEAEDEAQSSYEKFMAESTQSKEVKETEKEHKEGNKAHKEEDLRTTKKELALTEEELSKALEYYEKLREDCLDTGLSYEERVRAREEEIQSLQEALAILQGEDIA
jgi:predicted  nucleic acid-binding Zn-ribbon protein